MNSDYAKVVILSQGAFDNSYYLDQALALRIPDLWSNASLLDHYVTSGWKRGLNPSRDFHVTPYLQANPDVRDAGTEPLSHYLSQGCKEGRPLSKSETKAPRVFAFYLPQYHPDPQNELWWGKGFTDWTNVTRGRPMFEGHAQPILPGELGFYDLRLRESQAAQAALADEFGVDGFCVHYYWFNRHRVLEAPLNNLLADSSIHFPFFLCWANENWTRRWDGLDDEILLAQHHDALSDYRFICDILPILQDPRYQKVDGRPILLVYRPDLLSRPEQTTLLWREVAVQAGFPGLYLGAVGFRTRDPRPLGFDALV